MGFSSDVLFMNRKLERMLSKIFHTKNAKIYALKRNILGETSDIIDDCNIKFEAEDDKVDFSLCINERKMIVERVSNEYQARTFVRKMCKMMLDKFKREYSYEDIIDYCDDIDAEKIVLFVEMVLKELKSFPIEESAEKTDKFAALKGGLAEGMTKEEIAEKHDVSVEKIEEQLKMGRKVEMEHTNDPEVAERIAMDHLFEISDYYTRLKKMEDEAEEK